MGTVDEKSREGRTCRLCREGFVDIREPVYAVYLPGGVFFLQIVLDPGVQARGVFRQVAVFPVQAFGHQGIDERGVHVVFATCTRRCNRRKTRMEEMPCVLAVCRVPSRAKKAAKNHFKVKILTQVLAIFTP